MKAPVFIIGMPRSGTTLVASILNASPELVITPETDYFPNHWRRCKRGNCLDNADRFRAFVATVLASHEFARLKLPGPLRAHLAAQLAEGPPSHARLLDTVLGAYARQHGSERWGEKTPAHALYVDRILEIFPEARIVHVVRDPRDIVLSLSKVPWEERGNIVQHVAKWRACLERPPADAAAAGGSYHRVRYEDLLRAPEKSVRALAAFATIPWAPGLLAFHECLDRVFDPEAEPWKRNAAQPLNPTNADNWRSELPLRDAALVELLAGDGLERAGYPRTGDITFRTRVRVAALCATNSFLLVADAARRTRSYARRKLREIRP